MAEMLRLTLRIAGQALFNIELSDESHTVGKALAAVNKLFTASFQFSISLRVFFEVSRDIDITRHLFETITEFMDEFSQTAGEFTTSCMEMLPWLWWQAIDR